MASLGNLSLLVISVLLSAVSCQQSIVSTNTITTGGSFSIYCDAKRVNLVGAKSITTLTIFRKVGTDADFSMITQYTAFAPSGVLTEVKFIPPGRSWNITFTGSNGGVNNLATMSVVVNVLDAGCSDAGMYRCQVGYYTTNDVVQSVNATDQNVTATAGTTGFNLAVSPSSVDYNNPNVYNVGDNITFTCNVNGPENLEFNWELWVEDTFGTERLGSLPADRVIETSKPVSQGGTVGCSQFYVVSTLKIQVPSDYNQQKYKCIVRYNNMEVESDNITIGISGTLKPTPAESVDQGSSPDVGMIVGIVIGCVALIAIIIIVILVLRYRKKSKGDNYKSNEDQPDAGRDDHLHAPPPVFYPSSKPSKGSKDEKDSKTPGESERREKPRYDDYSNNRQAEKPYNRAPYYDNNYNHEPEATSGRKNRKSRQVDTSRDNRYPRDEQHYASTDISQSGDESADMSDIPLDEGKSKPRPKRRSQMPRKEGRDGHKQLHYAELDLPQRKEDSESGSDIGRRRVELPVEYAEIRV